MSNLKEILYKIFQAIQPKSFDKNEWFILFITCLTVGVVIYLHKKHGKMKISEQIFIFLFNFYLASFGDYLLATKPIDLYDTIDRNKVEFFDILLEVIVYPATMTIFMHLFVLFKMKKFSFIILGTCVLILLEWIAETWFSTYSYKKWKLIYSVPFYGIVLTVNVYLLSWIQKKLHSHINFLKEDKIL
ncbi:hypothetical protein HPT25_17380 [Bacillus sp. BRMEA1]|uniref:hypothetical protein n=1 Tax=Neobacillus endophyticus TaxID=2738405 RepID=UPI0015679A06|nr:hypothetical protein [Neobacillus endophyticus]NRD79133.1 hypothetical protein [Neobacillus endophyticus]